MGMPVPKMPADWELRPDPEEADPFRYGWRPKYVRRAGGKVEEQRIPLTAEDLLDPQLGDVTLVQGGPHWKLSRRLGEVLDLFFEDDPDVMITGDMKILWGIPGLKDPAPDIAVIRGAGDEDEVREVFDVVKKGVRPCLIIEVVSPKYEEIRRNDYVEKKVIYERAGIPEYLIVEPFRTRGNPIRQWTGYRLGTNGRYQRIEPDGEGRLLSETTGLLFGIAEDGGFQVTNAQTGERLLDLSQLSSAKNDAEERAAREADARLAAEQRAAREAERAARETKRAAREAEARGIAEEAIKAAEAEIDRLRAELGRVSKS